MIDNLFFLLPVNIGSADVNPASAVDNAETDASRNTDKNHEATFSESLLDEGNDMEIDDHSIHETHTDHFAIDAEGDEGQQEQDAVHDASNETVNDSMALDENSFAPHNDDIHEDSGTEEHNQGEVVPQTVTVSTPSGDSAKGAKKKVTNSSRAGVRLSRSPAPVRRIDPAEERSRSIYLRGDRWQVIVVFPGRSRYLGSFNSEEEANIAYDIAIAQRNILVQRGETNLTKVKVHGVEKMEGVGTMALLAASANGGGVGRKKIRVNEAITEEEAISRMSDKR